MPRSFVRSASLGVAACAAALVCRCRRRVEGPAPVGLRRAGAGARAAAGVAADGTIAGGHPRPAGAARPRHRPGDRPEPHGHHRRRVHAADHVARRGGREADVREPGVRGPARAATSRPPAFSAATSSPSARAGRFPGLILATLCAARALELEPVVIYSVGSSMYGANLPGFTFVDMLARLREDGILPYRIAAVSPGGDQDGGAGVLFDETGAHAGRRGAADRAADGRRRHARGPHPVAAAGVRRGGARAADPRVRQHRRGVGQLRRHAGVARGAERPRGEVAGACPSARRAG